MTLNATAPQEAQMHIAILVESALATAFDEDGWLTTLRTNSTLADLQAVPAPAHSQRPLTMSCEVVETPARENDDGSWGEQVARSGELAYRFESLCEALCRADTIIITEATASGLLAWSLLAHTFVGYGAASSIVFDLTPRTVKKLIEPLGEQVMKRSLAGFRACGADVAFVSQGRCLDEALDQLDVRVLSDPPLTPVPRRAPASVGIQDAADRVLDLESIAIDAKAAVSTAVLELLAERASGHFRVTVTGSHERIVRATPYLEDLVRHDIPITLKPAGEPVGQFDLNALRTSPLLALAFADKPHSGAQSLEDVRRLREVRLDAVPTRWVSHIARQLFDTLGNGVKNLALSSGNILVDQR